MPESDQAALHHFHPHAGLPLLDSRYCAHSGRSDYQGDEMLDHDRSAGSLHIPGDKNMPRIVLGRGLPSASIVSKRPSVRAARTSLSNRP